MDSAREHWKETISHEGGHCPVCDRWGRIYKRNINSTMAKSLLWLASNEGWVDIPNKAPRWLVRSNQLPTLKWWGLVERKPVDKKANTKHSGIWRMTENGIDFALKGKSIPKSVFTYNDMVEFTSAEEVKIQDCFKDYFDYKEVMGTYFKQEIL